MYISLSCMISCKPSSVARQKCLKDILFRPCIDQYVTCRQSHCLFQTVVSFLIHHGCQPVVISHTTAVNTYKQYMLNLLAVEPKFTRPACHRLCSGRCASPAAARLCSHALCCCRALHAPMGQTDGRAVYRRTQHRFNMVTVYIRDQRRPTQ